MFREGAIERDEPFARFLWFTSIGRHHFGNRPPSDLTFFEWELAWADDLTRPAGVIGKVLDEHIAWHAEADQVHHDLAGVTVEKVDRIVAALIRDFNVVAGERDAEALT